MNEFSAYVGLDVHKDTIAVAVAMPGREEPVYRGEIENQRRSLVRLIRSLSPHGEVLSLWYEAGPCGYGVYREFIDTSHHCDVVAPSLIPRRAGERVKTDRRDAVKLARLHRSGELRAVWVPDEEQEAMRDLIRAREACETGLAVLRNPSLQSAYRNVRCSGCLGQGNALLDMRAQGLEPA